MVVSTIDGGRTTPFLSVIALDTITVTAPSTVEDAAMNPVQDDRYMVFVRTSRGAGETDEQPLTSCATYAEARHLLRRLQREPGELVIRFIGPSGGGD